MSFVNSVFLVGNVCRDPYVNSPEEGKMTVAEFSLATSIPPKEKGGEWGADFHNVKAFGKAGDKVAAMVRKGDRVSVSGELKTDSYTNKDGVKCYKTYVRIPFAQALVVEPKTGSQGQQEDLPF